jgi:hypothetical protein
MSYQKDKAPAMLFYVRDWLADPALMCCRASTRGIWINVLCFMWLSKERGKMVIWPESFDRFINCSETERDDFFTDARVYRFCDMETTPEGAVILVNRRMHREWKSAVSGRLRQYRFRKGHKAPQGASGRIDEPASSGDAACHDEVTPPSSSASAIASATAEETPLHSEGSSGDVSLRQGVRFFGEEDEATPCLSVNAPGTDRLCKPMSIGEILKTKKFFRVNPLTGAREEVKRD